MTSAYWQETQLRKLEKNNAFATQVTNGKYFNLQIYNKLKYMYIDLSK